MPDWNADNIDNITKEEYHAMTDDEYKALDGGVVEKLAAKAKDGNWDEFESSLEIE